MNIKRHSKIAKSSDASEWCIKNHSDGGSPDHDAQFRLWAEDTENKQDYERCEAVWDLAGDLEKHPEYQTMMAECDDFIKRHTGANKGYQAFAVAASVVVLLLGAYLVTLVSGPDIYRTAIGEQRTVVLDDNSLITLNTDTEVRVNYGKGVRRIDLLHGQALFDVVPDRKRPFEVYAAGGVVRAVGTRFDVALLNEEVSVAVLEGAVEVSHTGTLAAQNEPGPMLIRGKSMRYGTNGDMERPTDIDIKPSNNWWEGKLDFEAYKLSDAILEFNRYTTSKLVIEDARINDLVISGVFRIGDTESFLFALKETFNIHAIQNRDAILLVEAPLN